MHAFRCTSITSDAKNYGLQDCLGDLMSFLRDCCGFGLPLPYISFIYVFVKKLSDPQKSAALGAGFTYLVYIIYIYIYIYICVGHARYI